MIPQIYTLDTKFNFGKFKGITLKEVIEGYESRYIGYLILNDVLWFILNPKTLEFLEKEGFFDNLDVSFYCSGGAIGANEAGLTKRDIMNLMKKRFEDYNVDPDGYTKRAEENYKLFIDEIKNKKQI
jgi:hypothetical protein